MTRRPRARPRASPSLLAAPAAAQAGHLPRLHLRRRRQGRGPTAPGRRRRRRGRRRGHRAAPAAHRADACRAGARMANNTSSALTFTSPAGHDDRRLRPHAPARLHATRSPTSTHRYYVLYALGADALRGRGQLRRRRRATRSTPRSSWYGYPESNVAVAKRDRRRGASFPALAGYKGNADHAAPCASAASTAAPPCSVAAGGAHQPHPARHATSRSTTRPRRRSRSRRRACSPAARATARTR